MSSDFAVTSYYPAIGSTQSSVTGRSSSFAVYNGVYLINNGGYYLPPINQLDLLKLLDANGHHKRAMNYLRDSTLEFFVDNNYLFDYKLLEDVLGEIEATGNGYIRLIKNVGGYVIGVEYMPGAVMVRLADEYRFGYLERGRLIKFEVGEIFHFRVRDYLQNVYGKPRWYEGGIAALLGEASMLSLYKALTGEGQTNEKLIVTAGLTDDEIKRFEENLSATKGGSGKTLTLHKKDKSAVQGTSKADFVNVIRPDNFLKVDFDKFYQLSVDTINEINGIPPEVMGQRSDVAGGNIELEKLQKMAFRTLVKPRQKFLKQINRYLPQDYWLQFNNPVSYDQIDPVQPV